MPDRLDKDRMRATTIVFVALLALAPAGLFADPPVWNATGHRIVAAIAERHLSPLARLRIRQLLGPRPLASVSAWADEYRGTPEGEHTATWHYVNVPDGQKYREPDTGAPADIIQALRYQERILRDTSRGRNERVMALELLVHFAADIHQPMHVGRASDRGGNDVAVRWFGRPTNLHSVWDGALLDQQQLSYSEYVGFLDFATAEEVAAWQASEYLEWAQESQDLRAQVYAPLNAADGETPNLGWDYFNAMIPIVERRLLQAGIRLAGVLNSVFGE
jgi:hypothetical protein